MFEFDSFESDCVVDAEQAMLESVVGMDGFLFDPLFDEEVELLASVER